MTFWTSPWTWIAALAGAVALLSAVLLRTRRALARERSRRRSQATRHGRTAEQFAPLLDGYPWDPDRFRFLGSPIDGVQFADDAVVLVEFKAGRSSLSTRQRRIRDLVEAGKVRWRTVRVEG